jgi:anhydro-N-acetylmuramic acid kinase
VTMRVCGLISGTSIDGIDAALVDFALHADALTARVLGVRSDPYAPQLRDRLRAALPPGAPGAQELCRLDQEVGQAFAETAAALIGNRGCDVVCSHGQTVYHDVGPEGQVAGTLQLGQPAWIAERTGLPVVADLRAADIAAGGQGAPLVPILDELLLADLPGQPVAVNLGGIANISVLTRPGRPASGFDTGPANALIDAAVFARSGQPCDRDGALAASGRVDAGLLAELLTEPYYRLAPPKSTGKELFSSAYLDAYPRARALRLADLVATLTELTARTVADAVLQSGADRAVFAGGGWRNPVLRRRIIAGLPGVDVIGYGTLGVDEDSKEALLVALIGWLTAHGLPGNVPAVTGARRPVVLGSLTPGRGASLRRPSEGLSAPARMVLVG